MAEVHAEKRNYRITYKDYDGEAYTFQYPGRSLWQAAFSAARSRRIDPRSIVAVESVEYLEANGEPVRPKE